MTNQTAFNLPEFFQIIFLESDTYTTQESNLLISIRLFSVAIFAMLILWGYITYKRSHHEGKIKKIKEFAHHAQHPHHTPTEVVEETKDIIIQSPEIAITSLSIISTLVLTLFTNYLNNISEMNPNFTEFNVTIILIMMGILYIAFVLGPMIYVAAKHDWKSYLSVMILLVILMLRVVFPYWEFIPVI